MFPQTHALYNMMVDVLNCLLLPSTSFADYPDKVEVGETIEGVQVRQVLRFQNQVHKQQKKQLAQDHSLPEY